VTVDPQAYTGPLAEAVAGLPLVDHHVHGALRASVDRPTFESMISEGPRGPSVGTQFDSQIGFAIRRWCAPVLGLEPHASADEYWQHRCALGEEEVNRRLLEASGTATYLVETGYLGDAVLTPEAHADIARADAREVVRLETVAEGLLESVGSARAFVAEYSSALRSGRRASSPTALVSTSTRHVRATTRSSGPSNASCARRTTACASTTTS